MAAGDLTASSPTFTSGGAGVKTAIDALNLAATTDTVHVVPVAGRNNLFMVFKVEREA